MEKYKTTTKHHYRQIMNPKKQKPNPKIHQPYYRAKILGGILIITGLILLINPTSFFIKLAFAAILIGTFMILLITEQSIPKKLSDAQVEGNIAFIQKMTKELKLDGNAIFLPKSKLLTEERVFIPAKKTNNTNLPFIDDKIVLSKKKSGKLQGISIPPSGLTLLKKIQKENIFQDSNLENIEEKLQTFVGMNLLRSVTLKKESKNWKLEIEKPEPCTIEQPTCNQYPCSTCSAVLTAITQATNQKIEILESSQKDKKTIFLLKIGETT